MSKKQRMSLRESLKTTGLFSLLITTITDLGHKIFPRAKLPSDKTKADTFILPKFNDTPENTIGLPGSKWIFGCSPGAVAEIASLHDWEEYPFIYKNDTVDILEIPDMGSWIDVRDNTNRDTFDGYWVNYGSTAPDPFLTNRRIGKDDDTNESGPELDKNAD